ncbi:hypothetical protein B9Z55_001506 [Caenorhabditis nigoni]|uniref:Uncharacterized protein n=1 Tax=Caenorhabditis nigoni TaxID=1611254 RepID=A0A2G5VG41_9PELO|nr:hypothetical protein B9Z55_001506 [Caenorhabditis nigoni]
MFPNLVRNFLEPGWKKRVSRICLEFSPNLIGNRLPESAKNININSVRDAQSFELGTWKKIQAKKMAEKRLKNVLEYFRH